MAFAMRSCWARDVMGVLFAASCLRDAAMARPLADAGEAAPHDARETPRQKGGRRNLGRRTDIM